MYNGHTKPTPNENPKFNRARYLPPKQAARELKAARSIAEYLDTHTECPEGCGYTYNPELGRCDVCNFGD